MVDQIEFAEVDLSEQIDNPWSKDTAIAIIKGKRFFSIKINAKNKNDLKKFFKKSGRKRDIKRHNRRGVVIIYSFLLYHLLKISDGLSDKIKICNDMGHSRGVNEYLTKICRYYGESPIQEHLDLNFKKRKKKKSGAHWVAKDVAHGRMPANITLIKSHIDKIKEILKLNLNLS